MSNFSIILLFYFPSFRRNDIKISQESFYVILNLHSDIEYQREPKLILQLQNLLRIGHEKMTSDFTLPSFLSAPRLNFCSVKCGAFYLPDLTHGLRCMIFIEPLYSSGKFLEGLLL